MSTMVAVARDTRSLQAAVSRLRESNHEGHLSIRPELADVQTLVGTGKGTGRGRGA